ncbi:MAG: glycogen debranching protein GlgX [Succinivibrionaceae bacterium]|nr:glycogen debranching protein GlgX [Succinivibrionaceae bacterium]
MEMHDSKIHKGDVCRLLRQGVTVTPDGCFFAVWAPQAEGIVIHVRDEGGKDFGAFRLPERQGGIWMGQADGVAPGMCYAIEALGREDAAQGLYFKEGRLLVDPAATVLTKPFIYNHDQYLSDSASFIPWAVITPEDDGFDWQGVGKPDLESSTVILYETHVKGFTKLREDIPEEIRGTYLGLAHPRVIAYLKDLGITAVQLMPVAASMSEPDLTERGLCNYWGYNPVCFRAPDPRFATDPRKAALEFKTMVRELHRAGIAVILDVVYNHTAEGGLGGPVLSFKGLDNRSYYAFERDEKGAPRYNRYQNVTGCGNSFSTDSSIGLCHVVESLRHWLTEMQVDGFRFDLGVTVCRETHGESNYAFEQNSAFLKTCFCDEVLSSALLIAEPWDIGLGGYNLGGFPMGWSEQNDRFRDTVRRFWRGDSGLIGDFATRMMGSRDVFCKGMRSMNASVNFVTYHDGFTLEDLVSYSQKHNEANGYGNSDGSNENFSSNSGVEGPTVDQAIEERRWQLKRNLMATLLLSQGMPHILAGDEMSRTQRGNNNAYCQDNELTWQHWGMGEREAQFHAYVRRLISMRRRLRVLSELNLSDDSFHLLDRKYFATWELPNGNSMQVVNWQDPRQSSLMLFVGDCDPAGERCVVLINRSDYDTYFTLPSTLDGGRWLVQVDSSESDGVPRRFSNADHLEAVCARNSVKLLLLEPGAKLVGVDQQKSVVEITKGQSTRGLGISMDDITPLSADTFR